VNDLLGIHQLVISCRDLAETFTFYTEALGMAPATGQPSLGSAVTSFISPATDLQTDIVLSFLLSDVETVQQRSPGQVSGVAFGVPPGRLVSWRARLARTGVPIIGWAWAFGEQYLCFSDPSGLELALTDDMRALAVPSPTGPRRPAVGPLRSVEVQVRRDVDRVQGLLEQLGFRLVEQAGPALRFDTAQAPAGIHLDLVRHSFEPLLDGGPGSLRRLVLRAADQRALRRLISGVRELGFDVGGSELRAVIDIWEQCGIDILVTAHALAPGCDDAVL
jgi:catechol 2,3-dioxygenase-like lactoylglutathione lyase family enzyme